MPSGYNTEVKSYKGAKERAARIGIYHQYKK